MLLLLSWWTMVAWLSYFHFQFGHHSNLLRKLITMTIQLDHLVRKKIVEDTTYIHHCGIIDKNCSHNYNLLFYKLALLLLFWSKLPEGASGEKLHFKRALTLQQRCPPGILVWTSKRDYNISKLVCHMMLASLFLIRLKTPTKLYGVDL